MSKKYLDDVGTGILVANMKQYVDDSLTILPIEKITDFGAETSVWTNEVTYRRYIDLNHTMTNSSNVIFNIYIPDGYTKQMAWFRFVNSDGTYTTILVTGAARQTLLYHITNDPENKTITIYEIYYGNSFEISYDDDGNFVSKASTANVTSYNILTKLNSKTSSDTYTPSSNTDVATKEYVDNSILEIEDLSSEDITALFSS